MKKKRVVKSYSEKGKSCSECGVKFGWTYQYKSKNFCEVCLGSDIGISEFCLNQIIMYLEKDHWAEVISEKMLDDKISKGFIPYYGDNNNMKLYFRSEEDEMEENFDNLQDELELNALIQHHQS